MPGLVSTNGQPLAPVRRTSPIVHGGPRDNAGRPTRLFCAQTERWDRERGYYRPLPRRYFHAASYLEAKVHAARLMGADERLVACALAIGMWGTEEKGALAEKGLAQLV
jgi:hypothetical protein